MSDPAVEVAKSVIAEVEAHYWQRGADDIGEVALAAAREALAPIRELHREMTDEETAEIWPGKVGQTLCAECTHDDRAVLLADCATARFIYTTEELEQS